MGTTESGFAPQWMNSAQAEAHQRGVTTAVEAANIAAATGDHRIRLEDVVTFKPPAFLTSDYDPTYRPAVRG